MSEARRSMPGGIEHSLENEDVVDAYARWAPLYDFAFSWYTRPGRFAAVAAAAKTQGLVLDAGVGTGLELPLFGRDRCVIGVDLSQAMLSRAVARARDECLPQVGGLARMDATRLGFRDETFGCVVAPFVLTVAPEPERMLDELARVVKRGGDIILVNHVSSDNGPLAPVEPWLDRHIAPRLGWRLQFPWSVVGDWLAARPDLRLLERRRLPPFGLVTLTRVRRAPAVAPRLAESMGRTPEPASV